MTISDQDPTTGSQPVAQSHAGPEGAPSLQRRPRPLDATGESATRRAVLRRSATMLLGLGVVGFTTACGSSGSAVGTDPATTPVQGVSDVVVDDNFFEPAAIEVRRGATITWRWHGAMPHNVVGDDFESAIQTEGTFTHTFTDPGVYDYRCTLHAGMQGRVVVVEADE